jgi:hypothetical protein
MIHNTTTPDNNPTVSEVYTDLEIKPLTPHVVPIPHNATNLEVFHIKDAEAVIGYHVPEGFHFLQVPFTMKEKGKLSDGYHTFDELYDHRCILYIAMCKLLSEKRDSPSVWRSKKHSDDSVWDGWFLLGISTRKGEQITYHLPEKLWNGTHFATVLEKAPEFDGHTSEDVLSRILKLVLS